MEIERENRLLLEKMSMIMESGRPEMASANTTEFAPGTRLDRHQYPMVGTCSTFAWFGLLQIAAAG